MTLDRRDFLKAAAAGALVAGGFLLPFGSSASAKSVSTLTDAHRPRPFQTAFTKPPKLRGRVVRGRLQDGSTGWYRLFTVIEQAGLASIARGGLQTPVWGYGYVDDTGARKPVIVPGPTIDVDRTDEVNGGLPVKLRVINRLPVRHPQWRHPFKTSTHLHGSASLPQYDGYANDLTAPGYYKDYWYPNSQDARTLWYHDHGVHYTALNAYGGLAAQYHLHDATQEQDLPTGDYDVGLTITDAILGADGRLVYDDHDFSGLWGDIILVNGRPWPVMDVKPRVYRFRILNASLSRSLRLHLSDGSSDDVAFAVVGSDGGLLPGAVEVEELVQAGAERYEVLVDFSGYKAGDTVDLRNRSNSNNRDFDNTDKVMRFRVVDGAFPTTRNTMTPVLPRIHAMDVQVSDAKRTRRFELDHDDRTNVFKIDERIWQDVVDSGYTLMMTGKELPPSPGDVEIWEFENHSGGWFHPMHIHLVDFRILDRNGQPARPFEAGAKDTVYVGESQTLRLLVEFTLPLGAPGGKYMVHCHNLPHEDHDMMQQFAVGTLTSAYDPIKAAPPKPIKGPPETDGDLALYGDTVPA